MDGRQNKNNYQEMGLKWEQIEAVSLSWILEVVDEDCHVGLENVEVGVENFRRVENGDVGDVW